MASIQGNNRTQWLAFGEAHDTVWQAASVTIGITELQGDAYVAKVAAARTKYDAMIAARNAAKAATQEWYVAADDMHEDASMLLDLIKGYAKSQANPNSVYALAEIPPPAAPTPAGPPVDCTELSWDLTNEGSVQLSWKGSLAYSQSFSVWRKLPGETKYSVIGWNIRAKSFVDETVPAGTVWALYQVKAHRETQSSFGCPPVQVQFAPEEPVVLELQQAA